jgi:glycosyltransferase involved in cell wall biosynthesis
MEVIYNAVDLDHFEPAPAPPAGPPTVSVVANLKTYKGQERFLRAFQMVVREIPEATAFLVGDGPDRARLESLAVDFEINGAMSFVGQVADTRPYVARSHVACLTSSHEGFPNALLEAMAMNRPVVATRVGGVPELVRDGIDGLLTSLDPRDIAGALMTLLRDEALRARMGSEARLRAEGFQWERVVRETEAVYRRVLERRSRRRAPAPHGDRDV